MKRTLVSLLVVVAAASPVLAAAPNETPLPDAGLDQRVAAGTTVHLDGTGSRDPDGELTSYRWEIRTITPDCPTCPRTRFRPTEEGRYEVTVVVTDDDGARARDTLYVHVVAARRPRISLAGDQRPRVNQPTSYTATLTAGAAPLDTVTWFVDGRQVDQHDVSGERANDTLVQLFSDTTTREVRAIVTDTANRTAAATLDVRPRATGTPPSTPTPSTGGSSQTATPSQGSPQPRITSTPTIHGPRLLIGSAPFSGRYSFQADGRTPALKRIIWYVDGSTVGRGGVYERDWDAGRHTIYAVAHYADGTTALAKFPDGTSRVIVDPRPTVSISVSDRFGTIGGSSRARDAFENVEHLTVRLAGPAQRGVDSTLTGRRALRQGDRMSSSVIARRTFSGGTNGYTLGFSERNFTPGENVTLSVTAVDSRGQTATSRVQLQPAKKPRLLSAGFVNDPVDSYDHRIERDRYAAKHVVKIDLNGVDPERFQVENRNRGNALVWELTSPESTRSYDSESDTLTVTSVWTGDQPDTYRVTTTWVHEDTRTSWAGQHTSYFDVQPSPPEIRLRTIWDGTSAVGVNAGRPNVKDWGIIVDAGETFDPDGHALRFGWKLGAKPITADNETAKFSSFQRAKLVVKDSSGQSASRNFDFHSYYVPQIEGFELLSEGPYTADDRVRMRVTTYPYKFSKKTYSADIGIEGTDGVRVHKWRKEVWGDDPGEIGVDKRRSRKYIGVISVPVSALANEDESPAIEVYNKERPDRVRYTEQIPVVDGLSGDYVLRNVSIDSVTYTVRKPDVTTVKVQLEADRDVFLKKGYEVVDKTTHGTEYHLEQKVQTSPPEYETLTEEFGSSGTRRTFLRRSDGWFAAGSERRTTERQVTRTEWRDRRGGEGSFTGDTREKLVRSARYVTKRQYEYTKTVVKTGTRTVEKCNQFWCYTQERTYTYFDTVTKKYWAHNKQRPSHRYTGRTKRTKVRDAKYETQYEYRFTETVTETRRVYLAEKTRMVSPATYEWKHYLTTKNEKTAKTLIKLDEDARVESTSPTIEWTLQKVGGMTTREVASYDSPENVQTTHVSASADVVEWATGTVIDSTSVEHDFDGVYTETELLALIREQIDPDSNEYIAVGSGL
jgi:hypothetical protein